MDYLNMCPDMQNNDILTMAFVNMQPLDTIYDAEKGFSKGTIFPNINKPLTAVMRWHT